MWRDLIPSHLITKLQFDAQAFNPSLSHPHPSSEVTACSCCASFTYFLYFVSCRDLQIFLLKIWSCFCIAINQTINQASNQSNKQAIYPPSFLLCEKNLCKICTHRWLSAWCLKDKTEEKFQFWWKKKLAWRKRRGNFFTKRFSKLHVRLQ
jgi:hypothetical protein